VSERQACLDDRLKSQANAATHELVDQVVQPSYLFSRVPRRHVACIPAQAPVRTLAQSTIPVPGVRVQPGSNGATSCARARTQPE
jgi:hypothetical protein